MSKSISASAQRPANALQAILLAALLAGTLDGAAAIVSYLIKGGEKPAVIFKFIASAVFGKEAYSGGTSMVVWGVLFHYLIALLFTVFFFFIYPRISLLAKNTVLTGLVYGLFAWAVMNLLVVPVSLGRKLPFDVQGMIVGMIILMLFIGLPIAFVISRYYAKRK